ncbi:COPII subunit [Chytriomyces hyalinus]|nr:COPII subunit [Chytriomyces hyalinus]
MNPNQPVGQQPQQRPPATAPLIPNASVRPIGMQGPPGAGGFRPQGPLVQMGQRPQMNPQQPAQFRPQQPRQPQINRNPLSPTMQQARPLMQNSNQQFAPQQLQSGPVRPVVGAGPPVGMTSPLIQQQHQQLQQQQYAGPQSGPTGPGGPMSSIVSPTGPNPIASISPQQAGVPPIGAAPRPVAAGRRAYPIAPQQPQQQQQIGGQPGFQQQQMQQQQMQQNPMMGNPYQQQGQAPNMAAPMGQQQQQQQQQQFMQPASVPQFGGARPPQFGAAQNSMQSQQPGYATQQGFDQPQQPVYGAQLQNGQQQSMMNQGQMGGLQNGMQNMNMGQNQRNPAAPTAVNLLQKAPSVTELETMTPPPNMSAQMSVSQSPHSICPPVYKRCTMNAIPQTQAILTKSKIPLGLILTPYRSLQPGEEPVPVVNPPQIVRCRRCRTYINPWVQFVEQGTRWKCNMCFLTNEVPAFFDWDSEARQQVDRMKRPELTHSVVEYIAPQEYMVRPPQPVILLFVIDVSYAAVQSGMVDAVSKTLLECLDHFPNSDGRTKVGFIAVDHSLHFFNLNSTNSEPQMLVMPDIEDAFLPSPDGLLASLTESRIVIEKLLAGLPGMFRGTTSSQNCLGRALQSANTMIKAIGGKIILFQSSLPNLSEASLKMREDPKVLGTPKEVSLLQPQNAFYKGFAVDCSRAHVSVDLFAFNSQYLDLATLSSLAKVTGGSNYYYPTFNPSNAQDLAKLSTELHNYFSRPLALEAVLRVRASKGLKMSRFHGNFFLRSTDLLALPTVNPDNSYAIEMEIQDALPSAVACFQTALLHTSSSGERRIRVLTLTIPVTDSYGDLFTGADQYAIATLLSKKGVEKCITSNLDSARDEMISRLTDLIGAYKAAFTSSGQNSMLILPENLKLLPLLMMSTLKHIAFRTSGIIPSDVRTFAQALMCVYPTEAYLPSIHPRFWAIHSMDSSCGELDDATGRVIFPPVLNLSSEKLERHGLYLLENGSDIFFWVGRGIAPELCQLVFGVPSYDGIVFGKNALPQLSNDWSKRVHNLVSNIKQLRTLMMTTCPNVYIVKEDSDPNLRMLFLSQLMEDKLDSGNSYPLFLGYVREKMAKPASMF